MFGRLHSCLLGFGVGSVLIFAKDFYVHPKFFRIFKRVVYFSSVKILNFIELGEIALK